MSKQITNQIGKWIKDMLGLTGVAGLAASVVISKGQEIVNRRIADKISAVGIWSFKTELTTILTNGIYDGLHNHYVKNRPPPTTINAKIGKEMVDRSRVKYTLLGGGIL